MQVLQNLLSSSASGVMRVCPCPGRHQYNMQMFLILLPFYPEWFQLYPGHVLYSIFLKFRCSAVLGIFIFPAKLEDGRIFFNEGKSRGELSSDFWTWTRCIWSVRVSPTWRRPGAVDRHSHEFAVLRNSRLTRPGGQQVSRTTHGLR